MTQIEITPAPALFAVEFEFDGHLGVSVILPATCALAAQLKAWSLFPEHKQNASRTTLQKVEYVEIDWQTGRTIVVKQKRPTLTAPRSEELEEDFFNDWHIEEKGAE